MTLEEFTRKAAKLQAAQTAETIAAEAEYQQAITRPPKGVEGAARLNGCARGGEPGNVGDRLIAYLYKWRNMEAERSLTAKVEEIAERYYKLMQAWDDEYLSSSR